MSFDRLPALEAQPTTTRGTGYSDSPEFDSLTTKLSSQLFTLTSSISRLNRELSLVGTKRDSESLRERVKKLLDETREGFKAVGEGVKRVQNWEDVSVSFLPYSIEDLRMVISRRREALNDEHSLRNVTSRRSSLAEWLLPLRIFRQFNASLLKRLDNMSPQHARHKIK